MYPNRVPLMNTSTTDIEERSADPIDDRILNASVLAQDQTGTSRSSTNLHAVALRTNVSSASPPATRQARREWTTENVDPLNPLSRVLIATVKYPDDATLRDYGNLQTWMYTHGNKRAFTDICEALGRMTVIHPDRCRSRELLNLYLMCAEAYQTLGLLHEARCLCDEFEILEQKVDRSSEARDYCEVVDRDRIGKKKEDVEMKLEFQTQFLLNLHQGGKRRRFNTAAQVDILAQLTMNNSSPEQCRFIWRQIVLQLALSPDIAKSCARWLLSYADRHPSTTLQHANSLYVALNLFLLGYGSAIFEQSATEKIDVFNMLDTIGRYFDENGNQSKQFPPIHKMAHVWGAAAVTYHLALDTYRYSVCASMMRVSFESLNICFLSSGIESLYLLARTHAPEFFGMMCTQPSIKRFEPECINYCRRQLEESQTCIRYSKATVDQFVVRAFNIDQSDRRV